MAGTALPPLQDPKKILSANNRKTALEFARAMAFPNMGEQTQRGLGLRRADVITSQGLNYLGVYDPQRVGVSKKKQMLLDPQVALMLAAAKAPTRTTTWSADFESKEIKALVEAALLTPHSQTAMTHHHHAVDFGYQVDELLISRGDTEYSWEDEEGNRLKKTHHGFVLDEFKDLDPSDFRFVSDITGHVIGITQSAMVIDGPELVLMEKLAHFVNEAKWGGPHGTGRPERVYGPWYWETVLYLLCNQYFERRAVPSHLLYAGMNQAPKDPDGSGRSDHALQSLALVYQRLLKSQSVVALPSEIHIDSKERVWDLKVLEDDPRGEQFIVYLQHLDTKIARGLLMPERAATGNDATGSFGQTVALRGLGDLLGNAMLDDVADVWNGTGAAAKPGILQRWLDWNGIKDKGRVKHSGITPEAGDLYADVLNNLLKAEQAILEGRAVTEIEGLLVHMVDGARLLQRLAIPTREAPERGRTAKSEGGKNPVEQPAGRQAPNDPDPEKKAASIPYVLQTAVEDDVVGPAVATLGLAGLTSEFGEFMAEVEGDVARSTAPLKEEVDTREKAAKAALLLLLLMSRKEAADGSTVPGDRSLEGLVWQRGGRKLKSLKTIAKNLPQLEARAATLPGGGLRLSQTGNAGLMSRTLRAVGGLLGPRGLTAGLGSIGGGIRGAVEGFMGTAVDHFRRANRKGAWGTRANWRALVNGGWPGRNRNAPPDAPNNVKWRRRGLTALDVNEEGILRNIENISLRVLGGIIETMRNSFGTRRILDVLAEMDQDDAGEWSTALFALDKMEDSEDLQFGLVDEVRNWSLNQRNTQLTTEAHLRAAYRASMLIAAEMNGFNYLTGLHPRNAPVETGPRGGETACRAVDGKVGTMAWWNEQGEKAGAPMPLEMFGMGWGCRMQFFPVPEATIIRDQVEVNG